ncbi:MAG: 3-dehydroquinate synthase [Chloroflexi bacterium]|nr:3-dehydroquinate synthase [Chloroflexota bacterium]
MTEHARIFLVGFSGTGKSAVGRRVAALLGWAFADADELIVERAAKPVEQIFADAGEDGFRALEREAMASLAARTRVVVSTGGGAMVQDEVRSRMLDAGLVVALDARPESVYARLTSLTLGEGAESAEVMVRPLLDAASGDPLERIESLKRERQWAYALAHWTVPTDGLSVEQAAHEVVRAWARFGAARAWDGDPAVAATVTVESGAYPVFVGWGGLEQDLGRRLAETGFAGRAYVISDSNVTHPYGRAVQRSLHKAGIEMGLFTVEAGEKSKSLATATAIYEWLAERRVERADAIVAVGGGVVGDLAGFVAATFLRGITLVQVPTSLTAMVDSSIGGKTAVDLPVAKNLVGAFHHPSFVFTDVSALATLPARALTEGWAEALKHGLALDAGLLDSYESSAEALLALDPEITTEVIARNAAVKARVVTEDERETSGHRMLLNYGHTIGHGLEAAAGYERYLHGEAVAIGMTGAARLGVLRGVTPPELAERQAALLDRFGLPSSYAGVAPEAVLEAMTHDKKAAAGALRWVLLEAAGRAAVHRDVPSADVERIVRELAE